MVAMMPITLPAPHRKMIAARLHRGEVSRKNFAGEEISALIAAIVRHSKLTDQQFAGKLGHADQSQLSRWRNGLDNGAALGKIWTVVELQPAFIKGCAERATHVNVKARLLVEIA